MFLDEHDGGDFVIIGVWTGGHGSAAPDQGSFKRWWVHGVCDRGIARGDCGHLFDS